MKLYTQEQVIEVFEKYGNMSAINARNIIDLSESIELPSDSLCINCDESKSTHNVCMDCMIKIGKENIELPSDEEVDKQAEHEDTYSKKALLQEAQNGCGTEHLDATMSNNKESSIMWLYEKMFVHRGIITIEEFEQAKAMHKDEHAATARDWWVEGASDAHKTSTGRYESFHDYYEKKFNQ